MIAAPNLGVQARKAVPSPRMDFRATSVSIM